MKKIILTSISAIVIAGFIAISCVNKNDKDALTPTYGSTGNKDVASLNNATTTGTINTTSSAQNSQMTGIGVGGNWTSSGCSGSNCLSVNNSQLGTNVTACFATTTITPGTYNIVPQNTALSANAVHLTVTSPTGQESGSVWYGVSGTINVTNSGTAITGIFTGVQCKKSGSNFPIVTVSGQVGCII